MSVQEEIQNLMNQAIDNRLDTAGYARLDELILKDTLICQHAVEFLDLDSRLFEWSQNMSSVDYIEYLLDRGNPTQQLFRQKLIIASAFTAAAVLMVAVVFSAVSYWQNYQSEPIARVAALSEDIIWANQVYLPGDLLRQGDSLETRQGFATIETDQGVLIDLSPRTEIRFDGPKNLRLRTGAISALVNPAGIGFTVETDDARIVDLGTEFIVEKGETLGTQVAVKQGQVEAYLLDASGNPTRVLNLTAGAAAKFEWANQLGEAIGTIDSLFEPFQETQKIRAGIRRLEGQVRYAIASPAQMDEGQVLTHNFALLVAEQMGITLNEDWTIDGRDGPVTLSAGTTFDSYLLHYEPTDNITRAGIGTILFHQPVLALISRTDQLALSDSVCSIPGTLFSKESYRGVELGENEDRLELDVARKSLFFHFDMEPRGYLDQVRILVRHQTES